MEPLPFKAPSIHIQFIKKSRKIPDTKIYELVFINAQFSRLKRDLLLANA